MLDDRDILSYLTHDGERIAFHGIPGISPGILFLGGYRSDMTGVKAEFLAALTRTQGIAFTRFDYSGHGSSSGALETGGIDRWLSDALAIFDQTTTGPQILVGSSMGGWLALLLARARPDRVAGVIGIAAAPDFTEDLIWAQLPQETKTLINELGHAEVPSRYGEGPHVVTRRLIESGRKLLVLREPLQIDCPVRLLHGMQDMDVPWQTAPRLAEVLTGADVGITLIKDGEHRLSRDSDLEALKIVLNELLAT